jgi:uncharacterized membrane protein
MMSVRPSGWLIDSFDGWDRDFWAGKSRASAPYQLRMILNWNTRPTMLSDLVKSGVWAMVQMAIGFLVGTAVTGSTGLGLCIALLAGSIGSFAYWLQARLWRTFARG